ncbi:MAG: hypothetical protein JWN30_2587, partial [Bacilli bacterium]|nr:hypothetical protein [Bacilli bacterium]
RTAHPLIKALRRRQAPPPRPAVLQAAVVERGLPATHLPTRNLYRVQELEDQRVIRRTQCMEVEVRLTVYRVVLQAAAQHLLLRRRLHRQLVRQQVFHLKILEIV